MEPSNKPVEVKGLGPIIYSVSLRDLVAMSEFSKILGFADSRRLNGKEPAPGTETARAVADLAYERAEEFLKAHDRDIKRREEAIEP